MRICFICGSLEISKDGVGDYTRQLAGAIIRHGHNCNIIALMDKGVEADSFEIQHDGLINIEVLRLPYKNGVKKNCHSAVRWVRELTPDWLSIQFVPYAFHNKGLSFGLNLYLQKITKGYSVHIMFHEIWVGISKISPLKHKVIGFFQRFIIKKIVYGCKPQLINTSNALYQVIMKGSSIDSEILPLFSNIPKAAIDAKLQGEVYSSWDIQLNNRYQYRLVVLFGTLYPEAILDEEIETQIKIAGSNKQRLIIISIGRIGSTGAIEFKRLAAKYTSEADFILYGEVSAFDGSQLLQMMDIAISCTPAQHIGKSGVYAMLKLHELPVLLPIKEYLPEYDAIVSDWYRNFESRPNAYWSVAYIAQLFEKQLNCK